MVYDEWNDTGGTRVYTYALEVLNRIHPQHEDEKWILDEVLGALGAKDADSFCMRIMVHNFL